ncbi:hypothetical protein BKA61DRAFT_605349 [Leptodontidium sp. MPI-SDFR-AT-0119]|nr:hypothetical protein BKA61DRAFT_605349 [Leptodontidium sp. MPI-SDFR-AT-0119]
MYHSSNGEWPVSGFASATPFVATICASYVHVVRCEAQLSPSPVEPQPQNFYQLLYFRPISTILAFVARYVDRNLTTSA